MPTSKAYKIIPEVLGTMHLHVCTTYCCVRRYLCLCGVDGHTQKKKGLDQANRNYQCMACRFTPEEWLDLELWIGILDPLS